MNEQAPQETQHPKTDDEINAQLGRIAHRLANRLQEGPAETRPGSIPEWSVESDEGTQHGPAPAMYARETPDGLDYLGRVSGEDANGNPIGARLTVSPTKGVSYHTAAREGGHAYRAGVRADGTGYTDEKFMHKSVMKGEDNLTQEEKVKVAAKAAWQVKDKQNQIQQKMRAQQKLGAEEFSKQEVLAKVLGK